ncbi:hypothetical protein V1514DRAFT_324175 [Lipomyces japonicus]|uniref:uncharacterized protein n=1 Tax=Lipomyces japonicus TaxID=56871 RepID=UPI0034CE38F0
MPRSRTSLQSEDDAFTKDSDLNSIHHSISSDHSISSTASSRFKVPLKWLSRFSTSASYDNGDNLIPSPIPSEQGWYRPPSAVTSPTSLSPASSANMPDVQYVATFPSMIDFAAASSSQVNSFFKKLTFAEASMSAVAVDVLAYGSRNSIFQFGKHAFDKRTFVLLRRAILRYGFKPGPQSVPEQVLLLSNEAVAYASDDVPGRQYVLRVSERTGPRQIGEVDKHGSQSRSASNSTVFVGRSQRASVVLTSSSATTSKRTSLFFHRNVSSPSLDSTAAPNSLHSRSSIISVRHQNQNFSSNHQRQLHSNNNYHHHHHHHNHHISLIRDEKTKTLLLIFDEQSEFMRWMELVRAQIKMNSNSSSSPNKLKQETDLSAYSSSALSGIPANRFDSLSRTKTNLSVSSLGKTGTPPSRTSSSTSLAQPMQQSHKGSVSSAASQYSVTQATSLSSSSSSASSVSLQDSLASVMIRSTPPARRESVTFASLAGLNSYRSATQPQSQTSHHQHGQHHEISSGADNGAEVKSNYSINSRNFVYNNSSKKFHRRLAQAGPPPSGPLPPIPTKQG